MPVGKRIVCCGDRQLALAEIDPASGENTDEDFELSMYRKRISKLRGAVAPCRCVFVLSLLSVPAWPQARELYQQTQYKGQEIGKLTGDVYYARMDDYVSGFMVTSEGIILVEPIGTEMA